MYISKVEITNFRNFRNFKVNLRQYSVIVGSNKSGKTNLIQAIRLAIDPSLRPSERILDETDIWDGPIRGDEDRIVTIVVELTLVDENEIRLMALVGAVNDGQTARFMYQYPARPKITILGNAQQKSLLADDENIETEAKRAAYIWVAGADGRQKEVNAGTLLTCLSFESLNAFRDAEGLLGSWSRNPLQFLLKSLNIEDKRLGEIATNVHLQAEELRNERKVGDLVDRINQRSSGLVGSTFATKSDLNVVTGDSEDLLRSIKLLADGNRTIERTSLGIQNILYLALLLERITARLGSNGQRQQQLLLALEEPEAHIHPHVQRSIFNYFQNQLAEVKALIVTTHSPNIASVSPLMSIVVLRDCGLSQGSKAFWVQEDFDDQDIKDIERYLNVTRAELVFAQGVVFVEGIAEQYLIPAFAKALGINLDHLGISVIAVDGVNFVPYTKLLSADNFNIPFVVLTDLDSQNSEGQSGESRVNSLFYNIRGQVAKSQDSWTEAGIYVGRTTLELDLIPTCSFPMIEAYKTFCRPDAVANFKTHLAT